MCGEARDGAEAVDLAARLEPDLIVMDMKTPRLDGLEVATRILEAGSVPIVMLTGFGDEALVERAAEVGVFGFLAKPFHVDDLVASLRTARARHLELAELMDSAPSLAAGERVSANDAGRAARGPTIPPRPPGMAGRRRSSAALSDGSERGSAPCDRGRAQSGGTRPGPAPRRHRDRHPAGSAR